MPDRGLLRSRLTRTLPRALSTVAFHARSLTDRADRTASTGWIPSSESTWRSGVCGSGERCTPSRMASTQHRGLHEDRSIAPRVRTRIQAPCLDPGSRSAGSTWGEFLPCTALRDSPRSRTPRAMPRRSDWEDTVLPGRRETGEMEHRQPREHRQGCDEAEVDRYAERKLDKAHECRRARDDKNTTGRSSACSRRRAPSRAGRRPRESPWV